MKKSHLKIIFAGSTEFSLNYLKFLLEKNINVVMLITHKDKKFGRGRKIQKNAIKKFAENNKIFVLQTNCMKDKKVFQNISFIKPDLILVIAFGLIFPKKIIQIPKFGCINVHPSILPRWRGPSPVQRSIIYGDKYTGVTFISMDENIDTGMMIEQIFCRILETDTSEILYKKLFESSKHKLVCLLKNIKKRHKIFFKKQIGTATYANKISKCEAKIDWNLPAKKINRYIRAFIPWPVCYFYLNKYRIRVFKSKIIKKKQESKKKISGTVIKIDKSGLYIQTGDGILKIEKIQFPGKKIVSVRNTLDYQKKIFRIGEILK
ncbi:methionyl-tRNA formyltransferase [bacterium endosymbiont of Pedicinus badii]|uniref:methionyl-tRNA formyltransferase n=1 Tax=bacterium endosymbiont of Pedicinus badii TaxID=1719126 RepID=UPI0009BB1038|nr:methionyl-tRNA formyltransferase [bacterium endosymbiont of Pedicinus badii]OQM34126.1 hypothetical protein AOQ89_02165 [bacterium endosymbiont of Pedicinus badii]